MKILSVSIFVLFLQALLVVDICGQEKHRVYEVSPRYVSLLLVSDQKCPLQLDNPRFLDYEKGRFEKVYTVFNNSDKSVRSFQIKELSWFGGQEYTKNPVAEDNYAFMPYESFSTLSDENELEFVDFNEKAAKKLGLKKHPKEVWIIMVTKVELSDGTIYDATSKYEAIEKFLQNLGSFSKMSPSEVDSKEIELREFIRKTINK